MRQIQSLDVRNEKKPINIITAAQTNSVHLRLLKRLYTFPSNDTTKNPKKKTSMKIEIKIWKAEKELWKNLCVY